MRKWLYDRPWIWIVILLGLLVGAGLVVVTIAELNRPQIVKDERAARVSDPVSWSVDGAAESCS